MKPEQMDVDVFTAKKRKLANADEVVGIAQPAMVDQTVEEPDQTVRPMNRDSDAKLMQATPNKKMLDTAAKLDHLKELDMKEFK